MVTHTKYPYTADGEYIEKEAREFQPTLSFTEKFEGIEEGAEVNVIESISVNGTEQTVTDKNVDIEVPEVKNTLASTSTTDALSAYQGNVLYGYIQQLQSIGKFLSGWNSAAGLPTTNPHDLPYTYNTGDYYVVSNICSGTNYRPNGDQYTGVASTTEETEAVAVGDMYMYDGTDWILLLNTEKITVDSSLSTTSTNPAQNAILTQAINTKQDILTAGNNITISGNTISATDTTYNTATSTTEGVVKLGDDTVQNTAANAVTSTANRTYSVQLNGSDQMVVNVPWTDNNTTYNAATTSTLGLVKLGNSTVQTEAAESPTSVANRTYPVQFNNDSQMVVNIPWEDTTYTAGNNVQINGTTISATDTTYTATDFDIKDLTDSTNLRATWSGKQDTIQAGNNITIDQDGVTINATDTTYSAGTNVQIDNNNVISATDTTYTAGTNVQIDNNNVISATDTTYGLATNTTPGLVKLGSAVVQTESAQTPSATANRSYAVQVDGDNQLIVNVPWTDNSQYYAGNGLSLSSNTFSVDTTTIATQADLATKQNVLTAGNNIQIDANTDTISATDTTYSAGNGLTLSGTTFSVDTTEIQPLLTAGTNIAIDANNVISATDTTYSTATSGTAGLVKLASDSTQTTAANTITSTSGRTYGVQLNGSDQMVVNVPWADTTYSTATSTTEGLVALGSDTVQTVAANSPSSTSDRTYPVQLNGDNQMVVNVPWADTTIGSATSSVAGTVKLASDTTQTESAQSVTSTSGRTYGVQTNSNGQMVVNVPWTDTDTTYTAGNNITISNGEISATDTTYTEVTSTALNTGTDTTAGVISAKVVSDYVNSKVSSVYKYQGSVATYADLPTSDLTVGDVYNVVAAYSTYPAGTNWAWTGSTWDPLGGSVDLSNYVTINGTQTITGAKTFTTSPVVPSKSSTASSSNTTVIATEAQVANMVSDTAYASSWDGVTAIAPSKNAVYDKIESIETEISGKQDTLSTATSSTAGIVKLGSDSTQTTSMNTITSTSGRTYGVQLNSNDQMVVNVPWTDTSTSYSAGTGLSLSGTTFSNTGVTSVGGASGDVTLGSNLSISGNTLSATDTTYSTMTASTAGLGKVFSDTTQTETANAVTSTSGRTYGVQKNSSDQLVVNVPWSGSTYTAGDNITISGTTISAAGDMEYEDFEFATGSGSTVTMDLNTTITPTSNFTVNAPSTILDGMVYTLRVTNSASTYTMTLGTNISNPYGVDLTLTTSGTDIFVFKAVNSTLQLQPSVPIMSAQSNNLPMVKIWVGTQGDYDDLGSYDSGTLYFCVDS